MSRIYPSGARQRPRIVPGFARLRDPEARCRSGWQADGHANGTAAPRDRRGCRCGGARHAGGAPDRARRAAGAARVQRRDPRCQADRGLPGVVEEGRADLDGDQPRAARQADVPRHVVRHRARRAALHAGRLPRRPGGRLPARRQHAAIAGAEPAHARHRQHTAGHRLSRELLGQPARRSAGRLGAACRAQDVPRRCGDAARRRHRRAAGDHRGQLPHFLRPGPREQPDGERAYQRHRHELRLAHALLRAQAADPAERSRPHPARRCRRRCARCPMRAASSCRSPTPSRRCRRSPCGHAWPISASAW